MAAVLHSRTTQLLSKFLDFDESVKKLRKKASEPRPTNECFSLLGPKAAYYNRLFQYYTRLLPLLLLLRSGSHIERA